MDKTHTTCWPLICLMQTLSPKPSDSQSVSSGLAVRPDGLKRVVVKKQEGAGKKVVST